jgi:1-deoxy-D-xylulose-5-phosphate synthase
VYEALKAAEDLQVEGISVAVANARFVKPLDTALLDGIAARFKYIVTIEENSVAGGFGSAVAEYLAQHCDRLKPVLPLIMGIPDSFIEHGAPAGLLADCGLTREGIRQRVRDLMAEPEIQEVRSRDL